MIGAVVALNGCGQVDGSGNPAGEGQDDGWTTAPRIEGVSLNGRQAVIAGSAASGARVLLRGDGGEAFAAGADGKGRFEMSVALNDESMILIPEVQQGQDAIKGPQRLVILPDAGLAVLQTDGGGSQRLTPGPILDAIDSDGRALVASGRGRAGQNVRISVPGRFQTTIKVGDDMRWSTSLSGVGVQGFDLEVEGQSFAYPGVGEGIENTENQRLEAISGGWRLTRKLSGKAYLSSWFPNR